MTDEMIKYHLNTLTRNKYLIMNIYEFLEYAKKNEGSFRNYCEIVILNNGDIVVPIFSSHINILELEYYGLLRYNKIQQKFLIEKNKFIEYDDIDELLMVTNACLVYYNMQKIDINNEIKVINDIINILNENKLITKNISYTSFREPMDIDFSELIKI